MSSGWDLKEGFYKKREVSQDEIISIVMQCLSNSSKKTTTYKYAFFKCLLDNLFNVNDKLELSFEQIFLRFTEIYWTLIFKYNLSQMPRNEKGQISSIENIIYNFIRKYNFQIFFEFESLNDSIKLELLNNVKKECKKYVVGAFFNDTKEVFYSFSKKNNILTFNPSVYSVLLKYKLIFEKVNYFEWIKFLEKVNQKENSYAMAEKLDSSTKRNNLSKYKNCLLESYDKEPRCFYCGKKLNDTNIVVDHFIPWSFLKDDKLWNFVLSCASCNSSKKDILTSKFYLESIIYRNKVLQDNYNFEILKQDFKVYKREKLICIYNTAIFNGFNYDWKPKKCI